MMRRLSITRKLIVIYFIIAIPLMAIITATYYSWYRGRVDRALLERTEIAQLTGTSFALFIIDLGKMMNPVGRAIVDNQYPSAKAAIALSELTSNYPLDHAVFMDSSGRVISSTDSRILGQNLSKHPAIAAVILDKKQTSIEPAERHENKIGFHVTRAIESGGRLQGIVAAFVNVASLNSALPAPVITGGANIIDSNGRLIYQSEFHNLPLTMPSWGRYGFVKRALSGKSATATDFVFPSTGRVSLVAEVPISGLGWAAGSSIDSNRALLHVRRTAIESAVAATVFLLLALAISINIARGIVGSLSVLVARARAVGEGNFDEPVEVSTGDEIEDVATSLDMARVNLKQKVEELRRARDELEKRVEERTAELAGLTSRMQSLLDSTDEGILGIDPEYRGTLFNSSASRMTGFEPDEVMGKIVHDLIHYKRSDGSSYPINECPIINTTKTGKGVRIDTEVFWRKDGTSFPVEYSAYPILENGLIKGAVIAFTEITRRKRTEALSNALDDINASITSTLDFNMILQTIGTEATEAIGAETTVIVMREDSYWVPRYVHGLPLDLVGKRYTDEETIAASLIARYRKTIAIPDAYTDERINNAEIKRLGIRSLIGVPLVVKDSVIGILYFEYRSRQVSFDDAQIDFITKLGTSVSLALENARLYGVERTIADTLQEALLILPGNLEYWIGRRELLPTAMQGIHRPS
ncbi:MAG: PAS domain S-box protein [Candidatus Aquicultor sp.]